MLRGADACPPLSKPQLDASSYPPLLFCVLVKQTRTFDTWHELSGYPTIRLSDYHRWWSESEIDPQYEVRIMNNNSTTMRQFEIWSAERQTIRSTFPNNSTINRQPTCPLSISPVRVQVTIALYSAIEFIELSSMK